jgi:7,8-dihydropterin-6-yl-methyl-4-(beta-D-ribofuranosyl)aminobenzene 5'-phosphate synthase
MIQRAQAVVGEPVHTVLGGFHLMDADGATIQGVLGAVQEMGVAVAGPTHCSGLRAMTAFQTAFGENFQRMGVGRVLKLPR